MNAYKSRDIYGYFWSSVEGEPNKHEYKVCGRIRVQKISNGYNNLRTTHRHMYDGEWEDSMKKYLRVVCTNGPMDAFVFQPSGKAKTFLRVGRVVNADNVCIIVEFCIGDNCATNRKLANDSGNTFV